MDQVPMKDVEQGVESERLRNCFDIFLTDKGMIHQFCAMTYGADQLNDWVIPLKMRSGIGETISEMQLTIGEEPVRLGVEGDRMNYDPDTLCVCGRKGKYPQTLSVMIAQGLLTGERVEKLKNVFVNRCHLRIVPARQLFKLG
jgi:hypothetical protein